MKTFTLALVASLLFAVPASAQQGNCNTHQEVMVRLAEKYGETRQGIGLAQNGAMLEVYASPETGTWTITVTLPGGPTCIVASGESWQPVRDAAPVLGVPG